jgi:hypothetical protein
MSNTMDAERKATESNTDSYSKLSPELRQNMGRWKDNRESARQAGHIGGTKGAITKRKRRLLRDAARAILDADVSRLPVTEDLVLSLKALGVDEVTGSDVLLLAQYLRAAKGDTDAARFVRDTSGEKPSVDVSVSASDRVIDAESVSEMSDAELALLADECDSPVALPSADQTETPVLPTATEPEGIC